MRLQYTTDSRKFTDCKWSSFDKMMQDINRIRMIKLNKEEWENSECTCSFWQKNYKCNHVISLATRLRLASFSTVAYSIPLQHKRKKGAPKKMASALVIQPNDDLQEEEGVQVCSDEEETIQKPFFLLLFYFN